MHIFYTVKVVTISLFYLQDPGNVTHEVRGLVFVVLNFTDAQWCDLVQSGGPEK